MNNEHDTSSRLRDQLKAIAEAPTDDFLELVRIANLDPLSDFVGADMSGMNLAGLDLRGFDFRGANFLNADVAGTIFSDDLIIGAKFGNNTHRDEQGPVWITGGNTMHLDPQLLLHEAVHSRHQSARARAIGELISTFSEMSGLEDFLKERAVKDQGHVPRRVAIGGLRDIFRYNTDMIVDLLKERFANTEYLWNFRDAARQLALLRRDYPECLELLVDSCANHRSEFFRIAAIQNIAKYVGGERMFELILKRALDDRSAFVRSAAVLCIEDDYRGFRDFDVYDFLVDRIGQEAHPFAINSCIKVASDLIRRIPALSREKYVKGIYNAVLKNADPTARREALNSIIRTFPRGSGVKELLVRAAQDDPSEYVRVDAIIALKRVYIDELDVVIALEKLTSDENGAIRLSAMMSLIEANRTDNYLKSVLIRCVLSEGEFSIRQAALQGLARNFPGSTEARQVLLDIANRANDALARPAQELLTELGEPRN